MSQVVGPGFSFMDRLKMGGIGTSKLQIVEATDEIHKLLHHTQDANYCYLECRPKGLIVGFNSSLKVFVWLIPYYALSVYNNSGQLTIYGPKNSIKLIAPFNGSIDKKFIKKILSIKAQYLENYNFNP